VIARTRGLRRIWRSLGKWVTIIFASPARTILDEQSQLLMSGVYLKSFELARVGSALTTIW
jgi:hypothetical protein